MRYPYLSERGNSYANEENLVKSPRKALLETKEGLLMRAIAVLDAARGPLPPTPAPATGVKALIQAHKDHQQRAAGRTALPAIMPATSTVGPPVSSSSYNGYPANGVPNISPENKAKVEALADQLSRLLTMQGVTVDEKGKITSPLSDNSQVLYDHQLAQQALTRIRFRGGRLFWDDDGRRPVDTRNMSTYFSGPGCAIYVMSQEGNIHSCSHIIGLRHHSSMLAGANVAGAGELSVFEGRLVRLSNKSGHYRPNLNHLLQTLHQLDKHHVPMTFKLDVRLPDSNGDMQTTSYGTVDAFLQYLRQNEIPDYELAKLLAYGRYLDDKTLGQNNWSWRWDPIHQDPGVYDQTTKVMVPHKEVRRWLKGQGHRAPNEVQSGIGR